MGLWRGGQRGFQPPENLAFVMISLGRFVSYFEAGI